MSEQCPLSDGGFFYGEQIPEVCKQNCGQLWEEVIRKGQSMHEEYPDYTLSEEANNCLHLATEFGSDSLQANLGNSGERFYGITELCVSCEEEIAEDSFSFFCSNN